MIREITFAAALAALAGVAQAQTSPFASSKDQQAAMAAGTLTSEALVKAYLARIEAIDRTGPKLNSVLALNPHALADARKLDAERKAGKLRGPLHGIPVLLKDNIESADDTATTAAPVTSTAFPDRSWRLIASSPRRSFAASPASSRRSRSAPPGTTHRAPMPSAMARHRRRPAANRSRRR